MKRFVRRNRFLLNALLTVFVLGGLFPSAVLSAPAPSVIEPMGPEGMTAPHVESVASPLSRSQAGPSLPSLAEASADPAFVAGDATAIPLALSISTAEPEVTLEDEEVAAQPLALSVAHLAAADTSPSTGRALYNNDSASPDHLPALAIPSEQTGTYYYVASFLGSSGPGTVTSPENSVDGQNGTYMQVNTDCDGCYENVDYSLGGVADGVVGIEVYSYAQAVPYTHWPQLNVYTSIDGVTWIYRGTINQDDIAQWRTVSFAGSDGITHVRVRSFTGSNVLNLLRQSNIDAIRIQAQSFTSFLPPDQTWAANECPLSNSSQAQNRAGGPINTYSGNYNFQQEDISIATLGQPLRLALVQLRGDGTVHYDPGLRLDPQLWH